MIKHFDRYTIRLSYNEKGNPPYKDTGFCTGAIDDDRLHFTVTFDTDAFTRRYNIRRFNLTGYRGDNEGFDTIYTDWQKYLKLKQSKNARHDRYALGYARFPNVGIKGTVADYLTGNPKVGNISVSFDTHNLSHVDWNIRTAQCREAFQAVGKAVQFYLHRLPTLLPARYHHAD